MVHYGHDVHPHQFGRKPHHLPASDLWVAPVALGADITLYHIPTDLESYYEPSRSIHVFVHWRPRTAHPATHIH